MQQTYRNDKKTLYLVATPIGNLGDFSLRAIETLKNVKVIFAEDTRTSKVLLDYYQIETPLESYFEHNKLTKIETVVNYLNDSFDVALISDAGMPGVSDPGYELIKEVINLGYNVTVIPGATASISALVASGLVIQPHLFIGFLPKRNNKIIEVLEKYYHVDATLIFYESPFRISKTLEIMYEVFGDREVVIARELTKIYETYIRTTLKEATKIEHINKGEYVILVAGYNDEVGNESIEDLYEQYMAVIKDEKEVFKLIAKQLGISKREVYQKIKIDK